MPGALRAPLPPATNDQRRRWADLIWTTIRCVEQGQTNYWTLEQLKHVVSEIEPPVGSPENKYG